MDWNSDGLPDMVSGDRYGNFNLFLNSPSGLIAYYRARVLLNGDSINVGNNSQPAVTDWNRDGKKDLLLGCETGTIRLYLNQATDTWPLFRDYSLVTRNGVPISLYRMNPYIFDLDQDGRRDLICGANDGYVHFFPNTGSDTNPTFTREETLRAGNGSFIVPSGSPYGSRLGFGDWNNDGWPDFLISGYDGYIELWLGEAPSGTAEKPINLLLTATLTCAPNPVQDPARIHFSLPTAGDIALRLYDRTGKLITTLAQGHYPAGTTTLNFSCASLPAGTYFLQLTSGREHRTQRITLLTD